jgi:hypothetical protein
MKSSKGFSTFIHRDDLMPVIRQGIFISIIGGLLAGAIQLLLSYMFDLSLQWFMLFVIAYFLAKRIRQTQTIPHIGFQVIAVIFLWISFYIMNVTSLFGLFYVNHVSELSIYLRFLNPLPFFQFLSPFRSSFFNVMNLIEVIFFIASTIYAYRAVK